MSTRNEGKHLGMVEEGDVGIGLSLRCVLEAKALLKSLDDSELGGKRC